MNYLPKSKWTSINKINGWRHYEVLNIFKKKQKVEMFSVCERNMKVMIPIDDLKDKSRWVNGWVGKNDNINFS